MYAVSDFLFLFSFSKLGLFFGQNLEEMLKKGRCQSVLPPRQTDG